MAELRFYKKNRFRSSKYNEVFSWCFGVALAIFLGVMINVIYGTSIRVVGKSMEPLFYNGQKVYINTFQYLLSSPKKGDIVVFLPNGNEKSHYYVKRVVATAGDKVVIRDGVLYVNDLPSIWVYEELEQEGIAANELIVQQGYSFCLGDNPDEGEDSRSSNLGPVHEDNIIGKVWFRGSAKDAGMGFVK